MHDNEYLSDQALVKKLIQRQFPQWADLALQAVLSINSVSTDAYDCRAFNQLLIE